MKTVMSMQTSLRRLFYLCLRVLVPWLLHIKLYPDIQTIKQALIQDEWVSAGLMAFFLLSILALILYSQMQLRELKELSSHVELHLFSVTAHLASFACLFLVIMITGFVVFPGWLIVLVDISLLAGLILCIACILLSPLSWVVTRVLK